MSSQPLSFLTLAQRLGLNVDNVSPRLKQALAAMRVALPCIVQAFDSTTQTVSVLPAIAEKTYKNENGVPTPNDLIFDQPFTKIPVCWYGAGDFVVTVPPQAGDECLVVFCDLAIDSWWQNGGANNVQSELRRHSWSDGVAILSPRSQPNKITSFNGSAMELRNLLGTVKITITNSAIQITGDVQFNSPVNFVDDITVQGIDFSTHVHSGVTSGASDTGPPL